MKSSWNESIEKVVRQKIVLSIGSLLFRKVPFWYYELCSELDEKKERERERKGREASNLQGGLQLLILVLSRDH